MKITLAAAHEPMREQIPFDAGTMQGTTRPLMRYPGNLSRRWEERWHADAPVYVVFSYATPIGWVSRDGRRVCPPVFYSNITQQHQNHVLRAWGIDWRKLREPAPYELMQS